MMTPNMRQVRNKLGDKYMQFTLKLALASLIALASTYVGQAHANQVVLCTNCVSTGQFEYAASTEHGTRRGWATYLVVNPYNEESMWVEVVYTPPGEVIMSLPKGADMDTFAQPHHLIAHSGDEPGGLIGFSARGSDGVIEAPAEGEVLAARTMAQQSGSSASAWATSSGERFQIQAAIRVSKDHVVVRPAPGTLGFASFADSQTYPKAVEDVISHVLTTNNPAWRAGPLSSGYLSALMNILKNVSGQGPTGCVLFDNGDSACFQINIMLPGSIRLLDGTDKDGSGNPLGETGGLPNGGGYGLTPVPNTPTSGYTAWAPSAGEWWLFCSTIGGKPIECYIEYIR